VGVGDFIIKRNLQLFFHYPNFQDSKNTAKPFIKNLKFSTNLIINFHSDNRIQIAINYLEVSN